jgi:glyoxylate/hydroxypyruvate reductase A
MRIAFACDQTPARPWLDALRRALPHAKVDAWQPGRVIEGARYAVVWSAPQSFFDAHRDLRAVFNLGAGVDALMARTIAPATLLVRLEDAGMAVQMAEYVAHAVIRAFREFDACAQAQAQGRWQPRKPLRRADFAVGLLGLGVLGRRVAEGLRAFDYPVHAWSRSGAAMPGITAHAGDDGLRAMLPRLRVLVNLLPLTPATRGIVDRRLLARLPRGAFFVNVARGAHVVEGDLLAALDDGQLAGATLDVFHTEPLPLDHAFWRHPKITITPHTSAQTVRGDTVAQIAGKIAALERGEAITGVVDRARGY